MKCILIHKKDSDFNKNIETLKNDNINVVDIIIDLKMFLVLLEDNFDLNIFNKYNFIRFIEEEKQYTHCTGIVK